MRALLGEMKVNNTPQSGLIKIFDKKQAEYNWYSGRTWRCIRCVSMVVGGCGNIAGSMCGSLVHGSCWDVGGSRNLNGVVVLVIGRGSRDWVAIS